VGRGFPTASLMVCEGFFHGEHQASFLGHVGCEELTVPFGIDSPYISGGRGGGV
jgi:hypothetical protein